MTTPGVNIEEYLWTFNMPSDHARVSFTDVRVPHSAIFGEEGRGLAVVQHFFNENRIRQAASSLGAARYCISEAVSYANERKPFGKKLSVNQGIQFPIARDYVQTQAAALMTQNAARLFDAGQRPGAEANMAKLLASEAAWSAADTCIQTYGGYGFAEDYDVERKFRETRLYRVAPISTNLILSYIATHELGMPRSF